MFSKPEVTTITAIIRLNGEFDFKTLLNHRNTCINAAKKTHKVKSGAITKPKTILDIPSGYLYKDKKIMYRYRFLSYVHKRNVISNFNNQVNIWYSPDDVTKRNIKIFTNGKIQVTGYKSENEIKDNIVQVLNSMGGYAKDAIVDDIKIVMYNGAMKNFENGARHFVRVNEKLPDFIKMNNNQEINPGRFTVHIYNSKNEKKYSVIITLKGFVMISGKKHEDLIDAQIMCNLFFV